MGAANRSTDDTLSVDGHEFRDLPESWAAHGRHVPREETRGQARVYAVSVALDTAHQRLLVRYIHPTNSGAFTREFDAVLEDGSWVPRCYADDGAKAFPLSLCIEHFRESDSEVRLGERDRLWELFEDRLAETAYSKGGGPA